MWGQLLNERIYFCTEATFVFWKSCIIQEKKREERITPTSCIKGRTHGDVRGGAMVLDKRPVPGRPINLGYSRAGAHCACSRCR